MCGINGIFQFSGFSRSDELIKRMNDSLAHRGPDAEGYYRDDHVQLGHRRLSIIDVDERANQPLENERYVLVFNGEIYNYKEVKAQLSDYPFQTESDTEVVLAAFQKWGEHCLRSFNGMFAFSIWDKQKKSLFIARDRLGIKPLYYVSSNDELIFSSSVRSILDTGIVERKLRRESIFEYLRFQTVHAPYTLVEGLFSLMPGQYLTANEEEGVQFKTYWSLTQNFKSSKDDLDATKGEVRRLLSESVEKRLVSDVPFGAFLSGGIDSSIIVALMSGVHDQKVNTFSVIFKENEYSEREYANMIADRYNTDHHEIELSVEEFKTTIPEALSFMDHPSGDGPNTYVVSQKTREAGVKMALTGLGGDELFGGYSIFNQIPQVQQKKWLSSFPAYARKPMANLYHMSKGTVASSKIKEILKQEYFDAEYIYQFYRQVLMDDQINKLTGVYELPTNESFRIAHELIGYGKDGWKLPPLSRISVADIATYMQNVLLRDSDQMSMAHGLELRVPFLDHELVEYVLGVPDKLKRPTSPKRLLVESFEDLLPREIYDRKKMGFVLPYELWMKGDLKSFCEERLNAVKALDVLKPNKVDELWKAFLAGNKRVTWSRLWPLVVLGDWIKTNDLRD